MECKDCCESIDGKPGTSACQVCLDEARNLEIEQAKMYSNMMAAMLDSIYKTTKGNYK